MGPSLPLWSQLIILMVEKSAVLSTSFRHGPAITGGVWPRRRFESWSIMRLEGIEFEIACVPVLLWAGETFLPQIHLVTLIFR